ncbi:MAG: hypothetical protein JOZ15_18365, partial [Acidobacteria bacterium]|nr:hypothetical protein [Acidobacteriota bacterium]
MPLALPVLALVAIAVLPTIGALPVLLARTALGVKAGSASGGGAAAKAAAAGIPPASGGVRFTDVTAKAGIHFVHNSGRAGKKYLPETLGPGCAFFDADGDGW